MPAIAGRRQRDQKTEVIFSYIAGETSLTYTNPVSKRKQRCKFPRIQNIGITREITF